MEQSTKFFNQIPVPIVEADDLNDFEKLLFSEIYTMANSFGSIFPSNAYLAKRYGKTTWTVSTTLKKLQEKGYIKMEYEFEGKEVKKRYIYPYLDLSKGGIVKNLNTPSEKSKGGIVKNQTVFSQILLFGISKIPNFCLFHYNELILLCQLTVLFA